MFPLHKKGNIPNVFWNKREREREKQTSKQTNKKNFSQLWG